LAAQLLLGDRSGEREVGSVAELLGGADNICVSTDFPHFDSSFPEVSTRVLRNPSITSEIAGKILFGGAASPRPISKEPTMLSNAGTIVAQRALKIRR
jgi:hypothetical protein